MGYTPTLSSPDISTDREIEREVLKYSSCDPRSGEILGLMERSLKERLVGAMVLVVLGVLLIPVFLDGGSKPGRVQRTLELPADTGIEMQTRNIDLDRRKPAASPAPSEVQPEARTPPPVVKKEQTTPAAAGTPGKLTVAATPKATVTGQWAVQLGSFGDRGNAERLAQSVNAQGYTAFVARFDEQGKALHRVRVGPASTRGQAESLAKRLAADGHTGQVVPNS